MIFPFSLSKRQRKSVFFIKLLSVFYLDGKLMSLRTIDRIEMEFGIRDAELIVREFELLERLRIVNLNLNP